MSDAAAKRSEVSEYYGTTLATSDDLKTNACCSAEVPKYVKDVLKTLHPEVIVTVQLNVARTEEEAEIQKQGKSIQELAAEEEAAAEFEIQELFDDIGAAQLDEDESPVEQRTDQPAVQEKSDLDDQR